MPDRVDNTLATIEPEDGPLTEWAVISKLAAADARAVPDPERAAELRAHLLAFGVQPLSFTEPLQLHGSRRRRVVWFGTAFAAAVIVAILLSGWTMGDNGHPAIASATAEGIASTVVATEPSSPAVD